MLIVWIFTSRPYIAFAILTTRSLFGSARTYVFSGIRTIAPETIATPDNRPRTIAPQDNRPLDNCPRTLAPTGQSPPRTIAPWTIATRTLAPYGQSLPILFVCDLFMISKPVSQRILPRADNATLPLPPSLMYFPEENDL